MIYNIPHSSYFSFAPFKTSKIVVVVIVVKVAVEKVKICQFSLLFVTKLRHCDVTMLPSDILRELMVSLNDLNKKFSESLNDILGSIYSTNGKSPK